MLFRRGDIVVSNRKDLLGIPMTVVHLSNELRVCECEYDMDGEMYCEILSFDILTVLVEAED